MTINEAYGEVQGSFIEWGGFFKDPNYYRTNNWVTWRNATDLVKSHLITVADLHDLTERRQFSFRVADDGSLIQLGYHFDRDGILIGARLAFYKYPAPTRDENEEIIVQPSEEGDPSELVSWIRLDFTSDLQPKVGHMPCHLHLSGFPTIRFSVFGVPSPAQFVEFIVSHFYPVEYVSVRLSPEGRFENYQRINAINSGATRTGLEPRQMLLCLPHIFIPGN